MKKLLLFLGLLLTSVYLSCAGKAKNAAVESAGTIKDTADFNTNVNTVADAYDGKENHTCPKRFRLLETNFDNQ